MGLNDTSASLLSGLRKQPGHLQYEASWERFIDTYTPSIYGWCRRAGLNHQDTEEITQQLMCRLVSALKNYTYDKNQKFRSWLFVCTRNVIFQFWKDKSRRKIENSREDLTELQQGQSLLEFLNDQYDREFESEAKRRIRSLINPRDWEIFVALTESSETVPQIAASRELTTANVYKIKSRVVEALKSEISRLQEHGIDS